MLTPALVRPARPADREAVVALLRAEKLEAAFVPDEFLVAEVDGRIVACGRLKPLSDGSNEIASVAVARDLRGEGLGATLVRRLLARARGPVHALALAPGFFARLGFSAVERAPEPLREKAEGICSSSGFLPMTWTPGSVLRDVQVRYGAIARSGGGCCADEAADYGGDLAVVPQGAHLGLGTGNPVRDAAVAPGEVVVDLGSGAGVDVFLAARRAGPTGRAIGIDATPEMVLRARAIAAEHCVANVEFHESAIERLPLPDASADVVVSNCVVNLSAEKRAVLAEAFRVLKPGGRLVVSDTLRVDGPVAVPSCDCADGAMTAEEWRARLRDAGFDAIEVAPRAPHACCGTPRVDVRARRP